MERSERIDVTRQMMIGDRVYEVVDIRRHDGEYPETLEALDRAQQMGANLGEEDAFYIMRYRHQIPKELDSLCFVFPNWRDIVSDNSGRIIRNEVFFLDLSRNPRRHRARSSWFTCYRVLRRK